MLEMQEMDICLSPLLRDVQPNGFKIKLLPSLCVVSYMMALIAAHPEHHHEGAEQLIKW